MPLTILFWVWMLLWLVLWFYARRANVWGSLPELFPFLACAFLGWRVFGPAVQ